MIKLLKQINDVFVVQDNAGNTAINLINFMNYNGSELLATANAPNSNDLFDYKNNTYDFKNNTIEFRTTTLSTGMFGLLDVQKTGIAIKNLTISINLTSKISRNTDLDKFTGFLIISKSSENNILTTVKNCILRNVSSTVVILSGLIGDYFNGTIDNCSTQYTYNRAFLHNDGDRGGIVGMRAGYNNSLIIRNCYNTMDIDSNGGGITGHLCGNADNSKQSVVFIDNCYNTGMLYQYCGGICGINSGKTESSGKCTFTIQNCYNNSLLFNDAQGGIFGIDSFSSNSGTTNLIVKKCYNVNLMQESGGGIFSTDTCVIDGDAILNAEISECYNLGNMINAENGGIFAGLSVESRGNGKITMIITDCYNSGNISESSGGITGSNCFRVFEFGIMDITIKNCYNTGVLYDEGAGGIVGNSSFRVSGTTNFITTNIIGCYNLGRANIDDIGGILGTNCGSNQDNTSTFNVIDCYDISGSFLDHDENGNGNIIGNDVKRVTIKNCYVINLVNFGEFGTGNLLGATSDLATVTTINCSYSGYPSPGAGIGPIVTLSQVKNAGNFDYRCIFENKQAPIIKGFLKCPPWNPDNRCLESFAPKLGNNCTGSCLVDGIWEETLPGEIAVQPCDNGIQLSRKCLGEEKWGNITYKSCNSRAIAVAVILGTLLLVALVMLFSMIR